MRRFRERLLLLPASLMTLCGAFVHPRVSPWLPIERRDCVFSLQASKADAAERQHRPADEGDPREKTTSGGGGVATQADALEEGSAMDILTERSPSPPLDILHRNEDFA